MSYFISGSRYTIVEHAKHDDYYFDAVDLDTFLASAFEILSRRIEWMDEWEVPEIPAALPTKREILDMDREDPDRMKLMNRRSRADGERKAAQLNNKGVVDAKAIIAEGSSKALELKRRSTGEIVGYTSRAWQILEERSDYEYERVDLVRLGDA